MDAARAGSPRRTATPAMIEAFSACSVESTTDTPPTRASQPSGSGSGPTPLRSDTTTTPRPRTSSRTREVTSTRRWPERLVGMQVCVQLDAVATPRHRLDGTGRRVPPEQHVARARELLGLDHLRLALRLVRQRHGHLGSGGDVAAGLDHAVVAQRDADAGVGTDQAAPAHRDDLLAPAGEGAHDRRAATHVGAVTDDDSR